MAQQISTFSLQKLLPQKMPSSFPASGRVASVPASSPGDPLLLELLVTPLLLELLVTPLLLELAPLLLELAPPPLLELAPLVSPPNRSFVPDAPPQAPTQNTPTTEKARILRMRPSILYGSTI
jgi:hypothetical protein